MLSRRLSGYRGSLRAFAVNGGSSRAFAAPAVQLYQYEICPFCCKVKAFLDWQKVPYSTVEVNPLSKNEIKQLKLKDNYKKVPVAVVDGEQVVDSMQIISTVASSLDQGVADSLSQAEMREWCEFADKELAVLLFPNITRNFSESCE